MAAHDQQPRSAQGSAERRVVYPLRAVTTDRQQQIIDAPRTRRIVQRYTDKRSKSSPVPCLCALVYTDGASAYPYYTVSHLLG